MKLLPSFLLAFVLATPISTLPAQEVAAPAATPSQRATATKPVKSRPFHGTVSAVDASAGTFTITNKGNGKIKTYVTKSGIPLTRGEETIALGEVKAGEYVRGVCQKVEDSDKETYEITSAKFGEKTAEEKEADDLKKAKKKADAGKAEDKEGE